MPSNNNKDDTGPSSLSPSLPSSSHTAFNDEIKLSNNNNSNSNSNSNQSNYDFVDTENQIATQQHERGGGGGEKAERGLLVVNSNMLSTDNEDGNTTTSTSGVSTGGTLVTYPADCYSFLALYHPWENFRYWSFGFIVWMFQVVFLILMIMRVVSKKFSTNPGTYDRSVFRDVRVLRSNTYGNGSGWTLYNDTHTHTISNNTDIS